MRAQTSQKFINFVGRHLAFRAADAESEDRTFDEENARHGAMTGGGKLKFAPFITAQRNNLRGDTPKFNLRILSLQRNRQTLRRAREHTFHDIRLRQQLCGQRSRARYLVF